MCTEPFFNVDRRANCDYYRPNMSSYTKEAKLVGCCDQNSFAHIITASGELDDILENVFIDINLTDRYIHGYNEFSSSRQCHLNVADDGKFVIVTDCSKTIFISVDCGRMFRKLEANNFFYKVEAAAKVSNYSSDNGTALLWVLGQNSSQTQLMTLRLERTSISYDVVEQKNIDLGVHSVSLNGYAASYTDIVDDGKGHMVFFRRSNDTAVPNNVYYCWVDVSTGQGYFGGVLIRAVDIGRLSTAGITSIAVDTNRSLLYLGHDKIISVYTLVYNAL
jgi:hypothetical protein